MAEHIISLECLHYGSADWAYIETAVLSILTINKEELADIITKITIQL